MLKDYFPDRNYLALYLNSFGLKFASALFLSFVGAHLYLQGIELHFIFIYFGLEFFVRAVFSPAGAVLTSRYGLKRSVITANIILASYFGVLSLLGSYPIIGFASFILYAVSRGIYYPTKHFMQATFVQEYNRGRFLTMEIVIGSLTSALAVLFATYSVSVWDSFWPVAAVAGFFLIFSSFAVLGLLDDIRPEIRISYREVLRNYLSDKFKADRIAFSGFAANMVFNNVVVALLVFFVVDSLELFGVVMAIVFVLEMALTLAYGYLIDKDRLSSNRTASFLQIASYVSFLLAFTPALVAGIKALYGVVWNIFDSSFTSRFHSKINRNGLLFASSKELSQSLAAAVFCFALSFTAYWWGNAVFEVSLGLASLGAVVAWMKFRD